MIKVKEKVAAVVGVATLFLTIMVGYANIQSDMTRLQERVSSQNVNNIRTIEVINKLAESVDKLSTNVARLDERTKSLEREDWRD